MQGNRNQDIIIAAAIIKDKHAFVYSERFYHLHDLLQKKHDNSEKSSKDVSCLTFENAPMPHLLMIFTIEVILGLDNLSKLEQALLILT